MIEPAQKTNKLIAVYGRVSTSNQEKEGTIESQLSKVREVAREKGFTIVKEYTDKGWSGSMLARPALDQLRQDVKKKIWEAVLVYDPDRIARNGSYQELVREELEEAGIELLFVTIPPAKSDEDKIMNKMRGIFAEYEKMKITERFRLGKVRKAKEGHIIASEAPYGYNFIFKKGKSGDSDFHQGYYEINEREAQIVRNMFSWVADEGLTLRAIVRKLQALGIPPRWSARGVWNTSTLSTLLRNKTYIGKAHYGASYAVVPENPLKNDTYRKIKKTSRRMKPESEWIPIKAPEIVSEDLFLRAGQRLRSNFEASVRNTKNEYLLSHRIWCPCGCRRAGEGPMHGKHLYYRCTARVKSFPFKATCIEKSLNARVIDPLVWQETANLMSSPELLLKQAELWINREADKTPLSTINVKETEDVISKLKEQEGRYAKAYGAGAISLEQLQEYTLPLKNKIFSFQNQIDKARIENSRVSEIALPELSEIEIFSREFVSELQNLNFSEKQAIVRNTIEKVTGTRSEIQVTGFIPININVFTLHRHRRPPERRQIDTV